LEDIVVPEAQDTPTKRFKAGRSLRVPLRSVLSTIGFDNKLACDAGKVGDERSNGFLAPKFESTELAVA